MRYVYCIVATLLVSFQLVAARNHGDIREQLKWVNPDALQSALADYQQLKGLDYSSLQKDLDYIRMHLDKVRDGINGPDSLQMFAQAEDLLRRQRKIALANPLLDMDKILVTKFTSSKRSRRMMASSMCMPPGNYMGLMDTPKRGYDAEICLLSGLRGDKIQQKTIFKPKADEGVADVQLHWNADRLLFVSSVPVKLPSKDDFYSWRIFEVNIDGTGLHQIIDPEETDLEFADPCYLPDGRILMTSNIGYNGIPCENGLRAIHNLSIFNPKDGALRKLSFDQDGNWSPTVLNNGRIMYTRWEYTDLTHYFSRIVMHANPDGTETKALYGSGSYWPNSIFDMHQLPDKTNQFVGIVTGHHGVTRSGQLFIFDPTKGRKEEKGVVQQLPYKDKKTVPVIKDYLVDGVWPQFTRPYPLNDKYFLVSAKLSKNSLWGIYLVDVFDNLTLVTESEGDGYITPIPVQKRPVPPAIPDRIKPGSKEATVFIQDLYEGEGLRGVPRGTVKKLRIFTYEYAYLNTPSDFDAQGIQSGWDIKRELGTVPVEEDGSAIFKVPANTPISIQPLDERGRAIQWMRSWFTPMPGEVVSCIGCHEDQNIIAIPKRVIASQRAPRELTPPEGGVHPFTFGLEIQPVLDKYCISCHDGKRHPLYLKGDSTDLYTRGRVTKVIRYYRKSYLNLHPYVYRQGPEADMYVLKPYEYHASNSELIQMLEKGHHGVSLSDKDMATMYQWIDFNAPYFGTLETDTIYKGFHQYDRRRELMAKYGGGSVDWKKELKDYASYLEAKGDVVPVAPQKQATVKRPSSATRWAFSAEKAAAMQQKKGSDVERIIKITPDISMRLVWIPEGSYTKGEDCGSALPSSYRKVKIKKGFWMAQMEVTNQQYKALFPEHDSRFVGQQWKDHTTPGYPVNRPEQPVVRVSWEEAMAYCQKLSEKTGLKVTLPTEEQWEWACRAGSASDMWFGSSKSDYSKYENLADIQIKDLAVMGVDPKPMGKTYYLRKFWDFVPRDTVADDGNLLSVGGGKYQANPWGLYDMHGNVAEWTASDCTVDNKYYKGYKVVCGGSWRDRAKKATSFYRRYFQPWQAPYNVGFRVIVEP